MTLCILYFSPGSLLRSHLICSSSIIASCLSICSYRDLCPHSDLSLAVDLSLRPVQRPQQSHNHPDIVASMCAFDIILFACEHNSGLLDKYNCSNTWQQFVRIYDPRERGLCFDLSERCRPQLNRNVKIIRHENPCSGCQVPGWQFRGTRRSHWT